ncbi:MAG: RdgB/HAM1 family non-canonical purine NTP pyrophosphatase [Spartobacteria bacterium]
MRQLFLATRNAHKTRELAEMLGPEFSLEDLRGHPEIPDLVEDGATFAENARLKATAVSCRIPGLILADDSGLEVDSLGGAPGVYSARYAGEEATDKMNRKKLLTQMAQLPPGAPRGGRFRCALALAQDGEVLALFEGAVEGEITEAECGKGGFGYDPLFQPRGFAKSFAELSAREKNAISHRSIALNQLRHFLATSAFAA